MALYPLLNQVFCRFLCAGIVHAVFVHQKNGARPFHLAKWALCPQKIGFSISPGSVFLNSFCAGIVHSPTRCFAFCQTPSPLSSFYQVYQVKSPQIFTGGVCSPSALSRDVLAVFERGLDLTHLASMLIRLEIGSGLWGPTV